MAEASEDVAEPFLQGFPEVRKLRLAFWFCPSFVLSLKLLFSAQVVSSAPLEDLPSNFVEGSYVTPVTFKRGDLYARGYLIDWWRHKYPTRSIDDLVDFLVRDYCDDLRLFPDSYVRIVRGS